MSKVDLEIYNLVGQKIKSLISQQVHNPNEYIINWDGKNNQGDSVASGVYICFIKTDYYFDSKKMVLIR